MIDDALEEPFHARREFSRMMSALRRRMWVIVATTILSLIAGALWLQGAPYKYDVTFTVTPVGEQASAPRNLSGLASLAGINLPADAGRASFDLYLEALVSRAAAEQLAGDQAFMRRLFAREWSQQEQRWIEPRSTLKSLKLSTYELLGVPYVAWAPPGAERLHAFIEDEIDINRDKESPLVELRLRTADPATGQELLGKLHRTVDAMLRRRALLRSTEYSQYLAAKLQTVTLADYRQALVESLSAQERMRMMASATVPFVADPFGQPVATSEPTSPSVVGALSTFAVVGLALGFGLALVIDRAAGRTSGST